MLNTMRCEGKAHAQVYAQRCEPEILVGQLAAVRDALSKQDW